MAFCLEDLPCPPAVACDYDIFPVAEALLDPPVALVVLFLGAVDVSLPPVCLAAYELLCAAEPAAPDFSFFFAYWALLVAPLVAPD